MPAIPFETDAALRVEDHLLPLEAEALENPRRAVVASEADPAPRVHDAMPRNPAALIQRGERIADQARVAGQARQPRDLTVSRHAPAGNARHDRVDPGVAAGSPGPAFRGYSTRNVFVVAGAPPSTMISTL